MAVINNDQQGQPEIELLQKENARLRAQVQALLNKTSYEKQLLTNHIRFMQKINIITYASDLEWSPVAYHGAVKEISGYDPSQFLDGLLKWEQLVHPEDLPSFLTYRQNLLKQPESNQMVEYRIISGEGQIIWLNDMAALVNNIPGGTPSIHGLLLDVTRRKLAEEALLERQAHLDSILNSMQDVIWSVTPDTFDLLYINPAAEKLYASADEFTGAVSPLISIGQKELLLENFSTLLSRGSFEAEYCINLPNGDKRWLQRRAHFARDAHGLVARIDGRDTDITQRKQTEEALRYISLHDSLTDLFNRFYFEDELQQIDNHAFLEAGLIVCDVDGLKTINDNYGHEAGDRLLVQCATILKNCFKTNDEIVCRIGGDEFTVIIKNCSPVCLESAVAKLRQAIVQYNESNPEFPISMSIGQALKLLPNTKMSEVFRKADDLMYIEKFSTR